MELQEIKQAMTERGYNVTSFADALGMSREQLGRILSGKANLTGSLKKHIELLLQHPREAILVYRVNIDDAKVSELLRENCTANPADRVAAIEAVIHHNLTELIEAGKHCDWSAEEREFLGIQPATAPKLPPPMPIIKPLPRVATPEPPLL